jgi:hypothetical protein
MRQVFSSARSENAEAVARMLEAEGIEVRVEHGRSFRKAIRGNFSYRDGVDNGPKPTVWVIRSEDQPRARQLLRDAGLLNSATTVPTAFLGQTPHMARDARGEQLAKRRTSRFRYSLIIIVVLLAAAVVFKPRPDTPAPTSPVPIAGSRVAAPVDPSLDQFDTVAAAVHMIPTPPLLAAAIASHELSAHGAATVCLDIEGRDPSDAALEALRTDGFDAHPASACGDDEALRVAVYAWRTDGSGSGMITWSVARGPVQARVRNATARRVDDAWHLDLAD